MDHNHAPRPRKASRPPASNTHSLSASSDCPNLTAALAYHARGWWAFPVCGPACPLDHPKDKPHGEEQKGKCPLIAWKWRVKRRPTEKELRRWWKTWPTANVAILTGVHSRVLAVDFDGPEGEEKWRELFGSDTPPTVGFLTSGRGRRALYQLPEGFRCPTTCEPTAGKPLHFLSDGSITVMPPSTHRTGCQYQTLPGDNLFTDPLTPAFPALLDYLESRTRKRQKASVVLPTAAVAQPATARQRARAVGLAKGWEPAIERQGGRNVAFALANALVNGLQLSVEEALSVMLEHWNHRCVPSWPEEELRERVQSAAKDGKHAPIPERPLTASSTSSTSSTARAESTIEAGQLDQLDQLDGPVEATNGACPVGPTIALASTGPIETNGASSTSSTARASSTSSTSSRTATARPARSTGNGTLEANGHGRGDTPLPGSVASPPSDPVEEEQPKTFGRLASTVQPRTIGWAVKPWIPERTLSLITGRGECGKTTFLHWLLAHFKRPVLFPGFELDLESMTIPKLIATGLNMDALLLMAGDPLYLLSEGEKLQAIIRQHDADVVAFDPITSYIGPNGEENQNPLVRVALETFLRALTVTGATGIGVLHPGKRQDNVLRGAAAWRDVPRVVLELRYDKRRTRQRTILVEKWSYADQPPDRLFEIVGPKDGPGKFRLGGLANPALVDLAREVPDEMERGKVYEGRILLRVLFEHVSSIEASKIYGSGKANDLSGTTMRRAADLDGVDRPKTKPRKGEEFKWTRPDVWPPLDD